MNFKLAIRTVGLALIIVVMGTFAQEMEENALRARFMRLREIITGEYCFYVALCFLFLGRGRCSTYLLMKALVVYPLKAYRQHAFLKESFHGYVIPK